MIGVVTYIIGQEVQVSMNTVRIYDLHESVFVVTDRVIIVNNHQKI